MIKVSSTLIDLMHPRIITYKAKLEWAIDYIFTKELFKKAFGA